MCRRNYKVRRDTGAVVWRSAANCSGGGGGTAPLAGGQLLGRERNSGYAQRGSDGEIAETFPADAPPAVLGNAAVSVASGRLFGYEFPSWRQRWRFDGDDRLATTPLIVGRHAYVASTEGTIYAVDLQTGEAAWGMRNRSLVRPYEDMPNWPLTGLTAGGGLLLVPSGRHPRVGARAVEIGFVAQ